MPFAAQPKSTRKRVSRRSDTKPADETPPRFIGPEEKHQLIMAHASRRLPTDRLQSLSLWAGVMICAAAIGVGWLYSVRQSMADAFPGAVKSLDQAGQAVDDAAWQQYQMRQQVHTRADSMIQELDRIEKEQLGGGLGQMLDDSLRLASSTAADRHKAASSTLDAQAKGGKTVVK